MSDVKQVASDLALGVRLAVGGSRKSWVRLALQGIGIGMCVAVLILAAALPAAFGARDARNDAQDPVSTGSGAPPLLAEHAYHSYRSYDVSGLYLNVLKPDAPKPPGVDRLPGDGEIVVSPKLAELLASPQGELLRPRFPQKVIGTIAPAGLDGPLAMRFYAGDNRIQEKDGNRTYAFGQSYRSGGLAPVLWLLSVVGIVILLFPVLVFVGVATRLAAAQRDRRLAALRLVGAAASRVRLIASGEALIGALVGLAIGFGIFFAIRPFVGEVSVAQLAVFPSDLAPSPLLVFTIVVTVPVLAVLTSLIAMRRTIVEPLGVVREQKPVRRRLWWRLIPALAGAALLISQIGRLDEISRPTEMAVVGGVALLMLGIPVLLPWLVERVVFRIRGGSPALQLAVRRLQLDSGTAARVVGGVAVVLAGAVTLQMILAGVEGEVVSKEARKIDRNVLVVSVNENVGVEGLREALEKGAGVRAVQELARITGNASDDEYVSIAIGTCEALGTQADVPGCVDGKAYVVPGAGGGKGAVAGAELKIGPRGKETRWRIPSELEQARSDRGGIYLTPAAAKDIDLSGGYRDFQAQLDTSVPDAAEHARNAIAAYPWQAFTYYPGESQLPEAERVFGLMRQGLYAGSGITLLLAGASMLLLALEQVRERRRPLAVMAASGVPRGTLARSLLWQNGVPLVLATVVAVVTGVGLGALTVKVSNTQIAYDWAGLAVITGAAMALVLVVTALTLPSLRRATGAVGLRTE